MRGDGCRASTPAFPGSGHTSHCRGTDCTGSVPSLRTLLPHHEGEKLSKAAILQQTAEYIYSLEQEKTRLLSQVTFCTASSGRH